MAKDRQTALLWSEEEKRGRPWREEKWKKTGTEAQREKGKRDVIRKRERVSETETRDCGKSIREDNLR